jgi:predicted transcriptional regulator of viral defense system
MRRTALSVAKEKIFDVIDQNNIYSPTELQQLLSDNRSVWNMPDSLTFSKFLEFLKINGKKLKEVKFKFPSRTYRRYIWGQTSLYPLVQSLLINSYFSHYTAASIHGLTEQIPKFIYLNSEQKKGNSENSGLTQDRIDLAFKNRQRSTNNLAEYQDYTICLLNGMNTNNYGVENFFDGENTFKVTDIERTLIDIAVRPSYAGGVFEVVKAYRKAKGKNVSINKLVSMLKHLKYTYPFHQAIGFYLEKSGYSENQINLLLDIPIEYNFYLTYQILDKDYSEKWKLFYPKGL